MWTFSKEELELLINGLLHSAWVLGKQETWLLIGMLESEVCIRHSPLMSLYFWVETWKLFIFFKGIVCLATIHYVATQKTIHVYF